MKSALLKTQIVSFLLSSFAMAQLPSQPTDPQHPGSANYPYSVKEETLQVQGRSVTVFLPAEAKQLNHKVPVVLFGHGQAIDVDGYNETFKHLAKKGVAVIHPTYDTGFFDQEWRRMAKDFNDLSSQTISKYADFMDQTKIIYSGHSKGGYIALMAAGAPNRLQEMAPIVLFAPAGYDAEYLANLNVNSPVSLFWSDGDSVIKQSQITEIYKNLPSKYKQWIWVKSYTEKKADHFYPLNKKYFFGGNNGTSAFHYHGVWKWLLGAAWDIEAQGDLTNPYIYGDQALSTGLPGDFHKVTKSW